MFVYQLWVFLGPLCKQLQRLPIPQHSSLRLDSTSIGIGYHMLYQLRDIYHLVLQFFFAFWWATCSSCLCIYSTPSSWICIASQSRSRFTCLFINCGFFLVRCANSCSVFPFPSIRVCAWIPRPLALVRTCSTRCKTFRFFFAFFCAICSSCLCICSTPISWFCIASQSRSRFTCFFINCGCFWACCANSVSGFPCPRGGWIPRPLALVSTCSTRCKTFFIVCNG